MLLLRITRAARSRVVRLAGHFLLTVEAHAAKGTRVVAAEAGLGSQEGEETARRLVCLLKTGIL